MLNKLLKLLFFLTIFTNYTYSSEYLNFENIFKNFSEAEKGQIILFVQNFNDAEKSIAKNLYLENVIENREKILEKIKQLRFNEIPNWKKPLAPIILYYILQHKEKEELFVNNIRVRLNNLFSIEKNSSYPNDDFYKVAFDTIFIEKNEKKNASEGFKNRYFIARYNTEESYTIRSQQKFLHKSIEFKFVNLLRDANWLTLENINIKNLNTILTDLKNIKFKNELYKTKFQEVFIEKKDIIFESSQVVNKFYKNIFYFLSLEKDDSFELSNDQINFFVKVIKKENIKFLLENTHKKYDTIFATIFIQKCNFVNYFNSEYLSREVLFDYIKTANETVCDSIKMIKDVKQVKEFFSFYEKLEDNKEKEEILLFIMKYIKYEGDHLSTDDFVKKNYDSQFVICVQRIGFINVQINYTEPKQSWEEFAEKCLGSFENIKIVQFYERILNDIPASNRLQFVECEKNMEEILKSYCFNLSLAQVRRNAINMIRLVEVRAIADYLMENYNSEPNVYEIDIDKLCCALERCKDKIENAKDYNSRIVNLERVVHIYNMCTTEDSFVEVKPFDLNLSKISGKIDKKDFDVFQEMGIISKNITYNEDGDYSDANSAFDEKKWKINKESAVNTSSENINFLPTGVKTPEKAEVKKSTHFYKNKYFWLKGLGTITGLGILFYFLQQTDIWKKIRLTRHF